MPRAKFDYVVSFSSEDPEHQANNLLNRVVSKKKWLCKKGESTCSVVLQLAKAVKIAAVHIGAYHAALVEVLVARSETSSDQFQMLVPSSVFVSRDESRRDPAVQRVRSFSADQLSAAARDQRWDRVRIVCSQPYNKHCKYGLSFVHIDEAEGSSTAALPQRLLTFDTFSSDEDEFKPGELFAKHLQKTGTVGSTTSTTTNTGAQIRQATSQALKNISESSTKLMKTPISKPNIKQDSTTTERNADRSRDMLMYTADDERPHAKIDHVVQRHKDERDREEMNKPKLNRKDRERPSDTGHLSKDDATKTPKRSKNDSPPRSETSSPPTGTKNIDKTSDQKKYKDMRKRRRSDSQDKPDAVNLEPHTILRGVVLVLSGYEHPRRAQVRNLALAMGATVQRDWGPHCTHLICAFPNTPRLRAVRAGGGRAPAVRAEWLQACSARRRRLPCEWFATEHQHRTKPTEDWLDDTTSSDTRTRPQSGTDGDTDDEIEKVLQKQKKLCLTVSNTKQKQREATPNTRTHNNSHPDNSDDAATDEEAERTVTKQFGGALPDFFDGYTFVIDAEPDDVLRMSRYVRAYGGLVLHMSAVEDGSEVDYWVRGRSGQSPAGAERVSATPAGAERVSATPAGAERVSATPAGAERVSATPAGAERVSAAWLARCHAERRLLPSN